MSLSNEQIIGSRNKINNDVLSTSSNYESPVSNFNKSLNEINLNEELNKLIYSKILNIEDRSLSN